MQCHQPIHYLSARNSGRHLPFANIVCNIQIFAIDFPLPDLIHVLPAAAPLPCLCGFHSDNSRCSPSSALTTMLLSRSASDDDCVRHWRLISIGWRRGPGVFDSVWPQSWRHWRHWECRAASRTWNAMAWCESSLCMAQFVSTQSAVGGVGR